MEILLFHFPAWTLSVPSHLPECETMMPQSCSGLLVRFTFSLIKHPAFQPHPTTWLSVLRTCPSCFCALAHADSQSRGLSTFQSKSPHILYTPNSSSVMPRELMHEQSRSCACPSSLWMRYHTELESPIFKTVEQSLFEMHSKHLEEFIAI